MATTSLIQYGVDTQCVTDTGAVDVLVTDPRLVIGQRLVRRLTMQRGALRYIGGDPNAGWDVRQYINQKITPAVQAAAQAAIAAECSKDEEVNNATCVMTLVSGVLTIAISVASAAGPFDLTLSVSAVTVDAIFNF